ncbi:PAS domain S-box protein [bacterium]|nr:PAS domain S-box protein [bacterium]
MNATDKHTPACCGWMTWLVVALGVLLSLSAFVVLHRAERNLVEAEAERAGFACVQAAKRAVDRYIQTLEAMRALYYSSEMVTRDEFELFARQEHLWHADTAVLGWAPRVPASERAQYEAAAQRDGLASFFISELTAESACVPASRRDTYYPVYYIHPPETHKRLLGFDIASEPVRCRAYESARDSGMSAITPPLPPLHDQAPARGVTMFMPLYRGRCIPGTIDARRAEFMGCVLARLDCAAVMAAVARESSAGALYFRVTDPRAEAGGEDVYRGSPLRPDAAAPKPDTWFLAPVLVHTYQIPVADAVWSVEVMPVAPLRLDAARRHSWLVLAIGLLVTALVASHHRDTEFRSRELERSNQMLRGEIADRQRAEAVVASSEERYRMLFALSPSGILLENAEGVILDANPALCASFGYTRDELVGADVSMFVPGDGAGIVKAHIARILAGETLHHEVCNIRKDGTLCDMELLETKATLPGGAECILVVANDISTRKRAEEQLRRSEERMRAILSAQPDLMFRLKRDSTCVDFHSISQELLLSPEEFLGKRFCDVLPPAIARMTLEHIERVFDKGGVSVYEYTLPAHGGNRVFEARMVVSGPDEVLAIVRDVTDTRHRDQETARTQRLESLGLLAGGIAHDFNNILTTILGNISLAKMADSWSEEDRQRLLADAERGAARAKDLTQQLLTFAKGGMPVKQSASLAEILTEAATFALRGSSSRHDVRFPPGLWHAEVDPGQIGQVVHNLVINADQAMPNGGVVSINAENILLDEQSILPLKPGPYVHISVSDTGLGVPPEHLERIFDPYFTTKQKGSGLGLTTVFSIIKKHGGHIAVESCVGAGTTFHIHVPALPESDTGAAISAPAPARVEAFHSRILVMDDEESIRAVVSLMLNKAGCRVQGVRDGGEAIAAFTAAKDAADPFDVVLLDLTIPGGMGGRETLAKLRELDPHVKAIVSSGYSNDPVLASYREYGFAGVVAKPFRQEDLLNAIGAVLAAG